MELAPQNLRRTISPESLGIRTTEDLPLFEGIVGQKRALSALEFGLGIRESGFHIYVSGPPGIGKMTAIQSFLDSLAASQPVPSDWCYLHSFDDPYQPKTLKLPPGKGKELQQDLKNLIERIRREIPKAFESESYASRREEIIKELDQARSRILDPLQEKAERGGFLLRQTPYGFILIPILDGQPVSDADFQALPTPEREALSARQEELRQELKKAIKEIRRLEKGTQEKLVDLDRRVTLYIVGERMEEFADKYRELKEVTDYFEEVQKDILEDIHLFKTPPGSEGGALEEPFTSSRWLEELPFRKYRANVLVDRSREKGAPVVVEMNPTYNNLFGRIEKETHLGTLYTDFTMIKSGSLHRADGGYLVLPIEDVFKNLFSWDSLKRALRGREVRIEEMGEHLGFTTRGLKPQPIPLNVKVILVGPSSIFFLLHAYDSDFAELFKVQADFDTEVPADEENIRDFLRFFRTICGREALKHLSAGAAAKSIEHALRLADDQNKLSTHFGMLVDLIREAHYWAQKENSPLIEAAHIRKALDEKVYRSNRIEKRIQEMISRGMLLVETTGAVTGQVNGISVIGLGDYLFGRPNRITASVSPGREGIVDIDREVRLGGPLHNKGVLILSGYLASRYAQDKPLTLAARLVFEQSYEGIEGDSASSAELFAILSALSGIPLKQGIAVTGSVNQKGEIQAVGGVDEKIEGFFEVCKIQGLDGKQGVILPKSNVQNLMLKDEVIEAVREGRFHLWAVDTIDEAIEILTGVKAGRRGADGLFPEESVNRRVDDRLREMAECLKGFTASPP